MNAPGYISSPPFEYELRRRNVRVHSGGLLAQGVLTGGAGRAILPPVHVCTAVGALGFAEAAEYDPTPTLFDDFWGRPWIVSAISQLAASVNPVDTDARFGIEIGSNNAAGADPAAPAFGLVRLYCDVWQGLWMLYVAPGGGGPSSLVQLPAGFGGVGFNYKLMLAYTPGRVQAYINGILQAEESAAAPVAGRPRNANIGAGVFVSSSNFAGDVTTADFGNVTVETIGQV